MSGWSWSWCVSWGRSPPAGAGAPRLGQKHHCHYGPAHGGAFDGSVGLLVNTLIQQNSLTQSDLDGLYEILRQAEEGEEESK